MMKDIPTYWQCSKVGHDVELRFTRARHVNNMDVNPGPDIDAEQFSSCRNAGECGVRTSTGKMNWAECIYPHKQAYSNLGAH